MATGIFKQDMEPALVRYAEQQLSAGRTDQQHAAQPHTAQCRPGNTASIHSHAACQQLSNLPNKTIPADLAMLLILWDMISSLQQRML